jgi:hypothetical protein
LYIERLLAGERGRRTGSFIINTILLTVIAFLLYICDHSLFGELTNSFLTHRPSYSIDTYLCSNLVISLFQL